MKNKTVLISGSTGFFGRICCNYFSSRGWHVLTATRHLNSDVYFDLNKPDVFATTKIDQIVDLFIHAAAAHEVTCKEKPYEAISQNIIGTKAALDFCLLNNIEHFVYLSTFHVFGNPIGVINEKTIPEPSNDYGLSHLQAEQYVQMYTRNNKIKGSVLRPTNFFGIPESLEQCNRWTLVPLAFCKDAIEKGSITLQTPGYQRRNFISITEICQIIETNFDHHNKFPLLHISGPETLTIRFFAEKVQRVLKEEFNRDISLTFLDGTPSDALFEYSSLYLDEIYKPKERLDPFIKALSEKLLKIGEI